MSHLKTLNIHTQSNTNEVKELADILDQLANESQLPLERAQFKLQKHWLENPNENVAEACVMFACFPGMAGIPSPDGSMTTWIPVSHMVCKRLSSIRFNCGAD